VPQSEGVQLSFVDPYVLVDLPEGLAVRLPRSRFMGKEGQLTGLLRLLAKVPGKQRGELGERANEACANLQEAFENRREELTL